MAATYLQSRRCAACPFRMADQNKVGTCKLRLREGLPTSPGWSVGAVTLPNTSLEVIQRSLRGYAVRGELDGVLPNRWSRTYGYPVEEIEAAIRRIRTDLATRAPPNASNGDDLEAAE